jgi:hypothetical protein
MMLPAGEGLVTPRLAIGEERVIFYDLSLADGATVISGRTYRHVCIAGSGRPNRHVRRGPRASHASYVPGHAARQLSPLGADEFQVHDATVCGRNGRRRGVQEQ